MAGDPRSDLPADDFIEIRDPEIDTLAILERIRERVQERRAELGYEDQELPTFSGAATPAEQGDLDLDPNLYHYLDLVNESYAAFQTEPDVQLSPATRGRILGRFWSLIRRQAHQLVLFYVNRSIEHQVAVNRQLVSVVNLLTAALQEQRREILNLRRRLDEMGENKVDE